MKPQTNQRELLKLQVGDFAYFASLSNKYVAEITQVKIIGDCGCEFIKGYKAIVPKGIGYLDAEAKETEIHTCNNNLFRTLKEAKEYAKKLISAEILSLKEQQSVISRSIHNFEKYKNSSPIIHRLNNG